MPLGGFGVLGFGLLGFGALGLLGGGCERPARAGAALAREPEPAGLVACMPANIGSGARASASPVRVILFTILTPTLWT